MKFFIILLISTLIYLQYALWIGDNGWRDKNIKKEHITQQIKKNKILEFNKQTLNAELIDLKNGQDAMKERAREEYSYIQENEILYRISK